MIRALIAADSFKGSLTSAEAGAAIAGGLAEGFADIGVPAVFDVVPIADGGEGTVAAFAAACGGEKVPVLCPDPLGHPVKAEFLILPGEATVVIEAAQSCGLTLVRGRENIRRSETSGLGRQISAALDHRPAKLLIGIGGSATNDWGAGMAAALGVRFLDERGSAIGSTPYDLAAVRSTDLSCLDPRLNGVRVEAICDVDNPLLGPQGAAAIYGPQKGADAETVAWLDEVGDRFADAVETAVGRSLRDRPGSGAAGGLGFGLAAFLGAELRPGIEAMIEVVRLRERVGKADLIVTGEGRLDAQSRRGKTTAGIAALAQEAHLPCLAVCGSVEGPISDYVPGMFSAVYDLTAVALSGEDSIAHAARYLRLTARRAARDAAALAARR
jgi:glycerate 2-kinase